MYTRARPCAWAAQADTPRKFFFNFFIFPIDFLKTRRYNSPVLSKERKRNAVKKNLKKFFSNLLTSETQGAILSATKARNKNHAGAFKCRKDRIQGVHRTP